MQIVTLSHPRSCVIHCVVHPSEVAHERRLRWYVPIGNYIESYEHPCQDPCRGAVCLILGMLYLRILYVFLKAGWSHSSAGWSIEGSIDERRRHSCTAVCCDQSTTYSVPLRYHLRLPTAIELDNLVCRTSQSFIPYSKQACLSLM